MLLQNFQRELEPGGFFGRDVIERLLKRQPVQSLGTVGKQLIKDIVDSVLSRLRFQPGIVPDFSLNRYCWRYFLRTDDQPQPIRQGHVRRQRLGARLLKRQKLRRGPRRQFNRLLGSRGQLLSSSKALCRYWPAGRLRL